MGFRITSNMMMNTYRYNLMKSTNKLSDARDKVLTQRNFNSFAEDPASATQAFRLRQQWYQTNNQLDSTKATYNKFHTAWTNLAGTITDLSDANARVSAIRGNNGTAGESRTALANVLRETADSVIQSLNQKVGDQFIFAGNDGLNVPFHWSEDGKTLYYRGIDVNTQDPDEQAQLKTMADERLDLDLGMGMKEVQLADGSYKVVNGSAFDASLRGIDFLNYGVDGDGDPQSLPLIMKELADVFETWGENGQMYMHPDYRDKSADEIKEILNSEDPAMKAEAETIRAYHAEAQAKAYRLMDKLNAAHAYTTEKYVELDAKASFLQTNTERLTTQSSNLNEQVLDIEQVDLADAITQFSWDQYCYSAALKIGNQLLSQSLIDYMN